MTGGSAGVGTADTPAGVGAADTPAGVGAADTPAGGARQRRLGAVLFPLLLAALGLVGALIAWRIAAATDAAGAASGAGLAAVRSRATLVSTTEARIAVALDGWLEYDRARQRAEALEAAGYARAALRDRTEAAANFFLMGGDVQYLDAAGQFDAARMRDALLREGASRDDIDPLPHFALADAEGERVRWLVGSGLLVASALPLLTLAEVTRGRLRAMGAAAGGVLLLAGSLLATLRWG